MVSAWADLDRALEGVSMDIAAGLPGSRCCLLPGRGTAGRSVGGKGHETVRTPWAPSTRIRWVH